MSQAPVPPFTERHEALRAEIRAFVAAELRPRVAAWEAERWFPDEVFAWLAEGGWLVNGAKTYITNGVRADFYVTAVRTRPSPATARSRSS